MQRLKKNNLRTNHISSSFLENLDFKSRNTAEFSATEVQGKSRSSGIPVKEDRKMEEGEMDIRTTSMHMLLTNLSLSSSIYR